MAGHNTNSKEQRTKTNKVILWTISIVIILIGLSLLVPLAQSLSLRASLESESNQVLVKNQSSIQNRADRYAKATAQKLGANSQAVHSVMYNSCYVDHSDRGWFANNYNYRCLITNFAFFEVNDGSDLMKIIELYAKPALVEGDLDYSDYYGKIYTLDKGFDKTVANTGNLPFVVNIVKSNTYTNVQEVLAIGAINSNFNVVAYANDEAIANRSVLNQEGVQTLDMEKTYIVLKSGDEYFHKDIGCRVPSLISCASPI